MRYLCEEIISRLSTSDRMSKIEWYHFLNTTINLINIQTQQMETKKGSDPVDVRVRDPEICDDKLIMKFTVNTNLRIVTNDMVQTKWDYLHFPGMTLSYHVNSSTTAFIDGYLWIKVFNDSLFDFNKCKQHIMEICREKIRADVIKSHNSYTDYKKSVRLSYISGAVIPLVLGIALIIMERLFFPKK